MWDENDFSDLSEDKDDKLNENLPDGINYWVPVTLISYRNYDLTQLCSIYTSLGSIETH